MEFDKEDVLILARAILDDPASYYEVSCRRGEYHCLYCSSVYYELEAFKHKLDCPVLVAQDIMTGNE